MEKLRKYSSPQVTKVELRIEEAVLTACKVDKIGIAVAQYLPPYAGGCYFGFIACQAGGS